MSDNTQKNILIIEESATLRYMLGKLVVKMDYSVTSAETFEHAVEVLDGGQSSFQGVILGWPHLERFDESKHILTVLDSEQHADVPVVLLAKDAEIELLQWVNSRKTSALVPWESYQESIDSLQTLLNPSDDEVKVVSNLTEDGNAPMRVLFVDDSKSIRVYYRKILEENGYEVVTADSVRSAYEIALNEEIDMAIVDYFMPDENGYVLCQMLKDNPDTTEIRTAVLTGTYLDSVIKDCLEAGAVECMFKNEAEELFLARVASIKRFIEVQRHTEKQRESLAAILESVGEGVYGVDNYGRITFLNPAALEVLGVGAPELLIGLYAHEAFHHNDGDTEAVDHLKNSYLTESELKNWETGFRHQTGKIIPVDCTVYPLNISGLREGSVVAFRDISNQKMMEERLLWQATHDHLTQLYNRRYFESALEDQLDHTRKSGHPAALIYIDLDRFKYINDTVGHDKGDQMLKDLSRILQRQLRRQDTIARIGGDEFAVIARRVTPQEATELAESFRASINALRVNFEDKAFRAEASIGVAEINMDTYSSGEVLANSDIACHIAKKLGRNQTHLYHASSDERNVMGKELGWSDRIHDALENNGFMLYYQPIMLMSNIDVSNLPAEDGAIWKEYMTDPEGVFHYEVLVRMKGEGGQLFSPDVFIPTAERFNLMLDIDNWVVENALRELSNSGSTGKVQLSINLSGHTLDDESAYERIKAMLEKYEVPPSSIIFEVTETCAIENGDIADGFINRFNRLGCKFSLDDFGSGFCSFSQLRNLPTDFVKIDGQFVKNMARGATDRAIVTAMNDVAHSLGRSTVAEYVETPEIFRLLKICGVDKVQGYYISRPLKELPHGNVIKFQIPAQKSLDIE